MLTPFFAEGPVPRLRRRHAAATPTAYGRFARALLDDGVYPPPSQFEAWFTGLAHGDAELAAHPRGARPGGRRVRGVARRRADASPAS